MRKRIELSIAMALAVAVAAGATPVTVSPGGTASVLRAAGGCPTFSWGAQPAAAAYELAVFELPPEVEPAHPGWEAAIDRAPLRLAVSLPAGVSSWTPPGGRCLRSGGRYAWFLRTAGSEEWSPGRFFEVDVSVGQPELERAVERVVERWLAESRMSAAEAAALTARLGGPAAVGERSQRAADGAVTRLTPPTLTGSAGLLVEQPDQAGIAFGVKGVTLDTTAGAAGLLGHAPGASEVIYGVRGVTESAAGRGVAGESTATSGLSYGVLGVSASSMGRGVHGAATSTSGEAHGVRGSSASSQGFGGHFESEATGGGALFAGAKDATGTDLELKADSAMADPASIKSDGDLSLELGSSGSMSMKFGGLEKASLDSSGMLTAQSFAGDGSGLSGVVVTDVNCTNCIDTNEIVNDTIEFADLDQNSCNTDEAITWNGAAWSCQTFIKTIPDEFVKKVGGPPSTMTGPLIIDPVSGSNALIVKNKNVGIGVDPPQTPLHVVGEVRADTFRGTALICPDCVDTTDVVDLAVTAAKIADDAVNTAKILDMAVTSDKIADGTIQLVDIGQNTCTPNQVLEWNGSSWSCATPADASTFVPLAGGSMTGKLAINGADGSGFSLTTSGDVDVAGDLTASKLAGDGAMLTNLKVTNAEITNGTILFEDMGSNSCSANEVMLYNGSGWVCQTPSAGAATDLSCSPACVAEGELEFNTATQAELDAHKGSADHDTRYVNQTGDTMMGDIVMGGVTKIIGNGTLWPSSNADLLDGKDSSAFVEPNELIDYGTCSWSTCEDAPEQLECPTGRVMVGIDLPEFRVGGTGSCGNEDDFRIRCCELKTP